jgi:EmrB/QacA subfamily drug resistance transporter
MLVISLDMTILNIALPALVRSLKATESQLQWIVDVYSCIFAGFLLVLGSVGDRVGRKKVFCVGLAVFAVGSAGSAFSTSVTTLIAARAVMGLGAACIMPATLSIITDLFREPQLQARAIGIWSGTTGLGIAIGPIAGGWLLSHYWWGSVFLINVPFTVAGLFTALWLVPDSKDPAPRRTDWVGAALSVTGLALLLWAIIEVPVKGWRSDLVFAAGAAAVVVLAAFVLWERRSSHPLLLIEPFANRRFSVAMASVALAVFALMGCLFVLTQYLQFSLGYSAFATGLRILPIAGVLGVAAVSSIYFDRVLGTKVVVAVGLIVVAVGLWQLTTTTTSVGFSHTLLGMVLLGFGSGFIISPATASVMDSLPRERSGVGSATNSSSLQVGGALGVAVIGAVLSSRYQGDIAPLLAGHSVPLVAKNAILGSIGGALAVAHAAGGSMGAALATQARHAFVAGMDLSLRVGAVVVAVSMVLVAAALPSRRVDAGSLLPPVDQGTDGGGPLEPLEAAGPVAVHGLPGADGGPDRPVASEGVGPVGKVPLD